MFIFLSLIAIFFFYVWCISFDGFFFVKGSFWDERYFLLSCWLKVQVFELRLLAWLLYCVIIKTFFAGGFARVEGKWSWCRFGGDLLVKGRALLYPSPPVLDFTPLASFIFFCSYSYAIYSSDVHNYSFSFEKSKSFSILSPICENVLFSESKLCCLLKFLYSNALIFFSFTHFLEFCFILVVQNFVLYNFA